MVQKTVQAMQRVDEIKQKREKSFWDKRFILIIQKNNHFFEKFASLQFLILISRMETKKKIEKQEIIKELDNIEVLNLPTPDKVTLEKVKAKSSIKSKKKLQTTESMEE